MHCIQLYNEIRLKNECVGNPEFLYEACAYSDGRLVGGARTERGELQGRVCIPVFSFPDFC